MPYRKTIVACVFAFTSCGGLAADGSLRADVESAACAGGDCPGELGLAGEGGQASSAPADARRAGLVEPNTDDSSPLSEPGTPGVGEPCGSSADQKQRITIGEIVLEASGSCSAGHLCLAWASSVDVGCRVAASGASCGIVDRDDEFVPVPPPLAPDLPAMDPVCTCHCAGNSERNAGEGEYCTCPEGMSCRELITSSGANGAAAEFVGSYCLY